MTKKSPGLRCEKRFPMDKKKIYIKHFMHQHLKKAIEEEMKKRKPEGESYQTEVPISKS